MSINYEGGNEETQPKSSSANYSQTGQVLSYQQAIKRSIGSKEDSEWRRYLFQIMILFVSVMSLNSCNFLILGLPFMKSQP